MFTGNILINHVVVICMIPGFVAVEALAGEKKCAKKCTGLDSIFPYREQWSGKRE
jgi:hypothetical protein